MWTRQIKAFLQIRKGVSYVIKFFYRKLKSPLSIRRQHDIIFGAETLLETGGTR